MSRIVGLDSMVMIYATQRSDPGNPAREEMRIRAIRLLEQLREEEATIVFPAIAVAELLAPLSESEAGMLTKKLSEQFVCREFDLQAAAISAQLWSKHKQQQGALPFENRTVLKADCMIVATAKACGASEFYSNDRACRELAKLAQMEAKDLPARAETLMDQFIESDIRSGTDPPSPPSTAGKPRRQQGKRRKDDKQ